jgi:RNA polymerase sigma-70 factor, ECF subfamily
LAYLQVVGTLPSQSAGPRPQAGASASPGGIDPALVEELSEECDVALYGLGHAEFAQILLGVGTALNFGLPAGTAAPPQQHGVFFRSLRLADLVLAQACAQGNARAWEYFLAIYQQPLLRAAIAITGSETLGRDVAGSLYAELYGLSTRGEQRRCPLESYRGRGSLIGWLRTTLAQRHVDHHRRTHREQPLEDYDGPVLVPDPIKPAAELTVLGKAIQDTLAACEPEERFLLASYYLDGRTLLQIAEVLSVHEATVSRKLHRLLDNLRKQVLTNLQAVGLSRRAAEEALGADPRDLDLNLKKLLQSSQTDTFQEKAAL